MTEIGRQTSKAVSPDWYLSAFTVSMEQLPWTEDTGREVDFVVDVLSLTGGEVIVDLGCGYGRHAIELASRGFTVLGIDLNESLIELAKAKAYDLGGRTIVLKLKTANFRIRTRSVSLDAPTQLADRIFRVARVALTREADGTPYRLLGVGLSNLCAAEDCDPTDLVDKDGAKRAATEHAIDRVRQKFGAEALGKGRGRRVRKDAR